MDIINYCGVDYGYDVLNWKYMKKWMKAKAMIIMLTYCHYLLLVIYVESSFALNVKLCHLAKTQ